MSHTLILSHAHVVQIYATEFQKPLHGKISIVLNGHYYKLYSNSSTDFNAAQRRLEFYISWFGDSLCLGQDYPTSMRSYLGDRLPVFTDEERLLLQETALFNAFYDMNHYSTNLARALSGTPAGDDWTGNIEEAVDENGVEIGPASQSDWLRVAPEGFRQLMKWV